LAIRGAAQPQSLIFVVSSGLQPSEILDWLTPGGLQKSLTLRRSIGALDKISREGHPEQQVYPREIRREFPYNPHNPAWPNAYFDDFGVGCLGRGGLRGRRPHWSQEQA
jgi:hypothetical protein